MNTRILCPVCEEYLFDEENDFDICSICGWENDGVQGADFSYSGGANELSVNEAKIFFKLSQLKEKSKQLLELQQKHFSKCKNIYVKYKDIDYRIDGDKIHSELSEKHKSYVCALLNMYENR